MNTAMTHSFGAEISRIAAELKESAVWPSPSTGLAIQLLQLCDCQEQIPQLLGAISFPNGPLDTAPLAAAAGYAMTVAEPQLEELSRWRDGLKRLARREPFPRDRQTFAYRPTELVGLAIGISKVENHGSPSASWIRSVIQILPSKNPPADAWATLLYHYAAAVADVTFSLPIPARLSECDTPDLALLIALLTHNKVFRSPEFERTAVQNVLLARVATQNPNIRDTEKLAALYGGLSLSLRHNFSAVQPLAQSHPDSSSTHATSFSMKQKILFLAANPTGTTQLALDEECRHIIEKIRATDHRDSLELITRWAVRPEDLLQHLNEHRPHIVHFSGHGTPTEEIVLLDKNRNPQSVPAPALRQLFTTLKDNIRVVLLNACFSKSQALSITEVVDCAIGMNKAIGDDAAISFAAAFYQAIGFGRSVKVAFESGRTALMLAGIPEENTPELLCKKGVDPDSLVLISSGSSR